MSAPIEVNANTDLQTHQNPFAGGGYGVFGPQTFSFGGSGAGATATTSAVSGSAAPLSKWIQYGIPLAVLGLAVYYIFGHKRR